MKHEEAFSQSLSLSFGSCISVSPFILYLYSLNPLAIWVLLFVFLLVLQPFVF